jgi:ADP-heptose:LPS heptosyltransferase
MVKKNKIKLLLNKVIINLIRYFPKRKNKEGKVCIFRKDGIGDCILFLPGYEALAQFYSDKKIHLVIPKPLTEIVEYQNIADKLITYDARKFNKSIIYRFWFFLKIHFEGYETFIYPAHNREPLILYFMNHIDAKEKICTNGDLFENIGYEIDYEDFNVIKIEDKNQKEIDMNYDFVKKISFISQINKIPELKVSDKWISNAREILNTNKFLNKDFAIIMPFSGQEYKNWPLENYIEIIKYLKDKYNICSIIVSDESNSNILEKYTSILSNYRSIVIKTELSNICGLMNIGNFYLGNDTGLLHINSALGKLSFGILGNEFGDRFYPYSDNNIAINYRSKEYSRDNIKNITVDYVKNIINNEIKKIK